MPFSYGEKHGAGPEQSTIRPSAPTPLPSSLRLLFEDDSAPQQESFRLPAFHIPSPRNSPSPSTLLSPTMSSARDRTVTNKSIPFGGSGDDMTAKQSNFAFPPRAIPRSRSKLSTNIPGSDDDESLSLEQSTDSSRHVPVPNVDSGLSDKTDEFVLGPKGPQSYRDIRSARGPPNIEIPDSSHNDHPSLDFASPMPTPNGLSSSTPTISTPSASSSRPPMNRKRSQSSAEGLPRTTAERPDLNLASPAAFHFPPTQKATAPLPVLPLQLHKTHNRLSPTHASASSAVSSPSAHQSTYSLDTSASNRRLPNTNSHPSPSIARTRSATALPETGPSVVTKPTRQAAATPLPDSPLVPPIKPFAARQGRGRSGSDSSMAVQTTNLGTPGLKDVLKVCLLLWGDFNC